MTKSPSSATPSVHRLLTLATLTLGLPTISQASTPPAGLSRADWESLRAQVTASRYAAEAVEDGGFAAGNPAHGIRVEYGPDGAISLSGSREGASWRGSLRLTGYGYDALQRVARPRRLEASGATVTYTWDDTVAEWWSNSPQGLEQGFTLARPPAGGSDREPGSPLRLVMAWTGQLAPRAHGDGAAFVDTAGGAAFTYTGLHTWDANGKVLPTRLALEGTTLTLLVEDTDAVYPVTVDPWVQQAYLKASNPEAGDQFGYSVAISEDTVVVGAIEEDSGATGVDGDDADNSASDSGAAYVFVRNGSTWSQQAYLKASNTGAFDGFGWSVAISGDTLVVGAPGEDSSATGVNQNQNDDSALTAGAAYVFVRSGSTWSQQAYLKASNTGAEDHFGYSVAISGDTVVIGTPVEDSSATGINQNQNDDSAPTAGAAYVFVRSGSTWSQQAYLKASNTGAFDGFGSSLAISGDTVVVGAPGEASNATGVNGSQSDNSAGNAGAAYVFARTGSSWHQQAYLKASNTAASDLFGHSVSVSGNTVVVGAIWEDSSATGVNGDQDNDSASNSGAAYVFVLSGTAWSQQAYLKASNTAAADVFGTSVAISGDIIVVGAIREDSNATGVDGDQTNNSASASGAAYVFARSGAAWSQHAYLKASNSGENDELGWSVAASGEAVVAGAYGEDSNATGVDGDQGDDTASSSGAAYVFVLPASADLSISKTDGVTTVVPGQTVTYTITATNAGPSNAPASTVTDTFPATLACSWTCLGTAGGTCTAAGSGNIADSVDLPAGASVTYTAQCTVSPSATGPVSNTASVAPPAGVTDPVPGNNSATDVDNLPAILADDFETADTSRWNGQSAARIAGGHAVALDADGAAGFDYDLARLPIGRARSRVLAVVVGDDGSELAALEARTAGAQSVLELRLVARSGEERLVGAWQEVAAHAQHLRLEWPSAASGGNTGWLALYVDGRLALWLDAVPAPAAKPQGVVVLRADPLALGTP
jgi:uncharacterized repeat protein (TIGR01451 family)